MATEYVLVECLLYFLHLPEHASLFNAVVAVAS